jgi:hypothetical protein
MQIHLNSQVLTGKFLNPYLSLPITLRELALDNKPYLTSRVQSTYCVKQDNLLGNYTLGKLLLHLLICCFGRPSSVSQMQAL